MEIFIIGIVLVGLMVYVSTRIKRAAAKAYIPETITKDDFKIEKPEGFLYPLNSESEWPFEAYSRYYGERATRNIWRARTRLYVTDGLNIRKIIDEIKSGEETDFSEKILDDLPGNQIGSIVRTSKEIDEVEYKVLRKIVANKTSQKTYELRTTILLPYGEEFTDKACEMMHSFELTNQPT